MNTVDKVNRFLESLRDDIEALKKSNEKLIQSVEHLEITVNILEEDWRNRKETDCEP